MVLDFWNLFFILSISMSILCNNFLVDFFSICDVSQIMPSSKLKSLVKETFTNLTQHQWYIRPLGSYELFVKAPSIDKSRRQVKPYGHVINVRINKVSKSNPTPIILLETDNGWLHFDPHKYDSCSASDLTIGQMMAKPLSKANPINRKMSNISSVMLSC